MKVSMGWVAALMVGSAMAQDVAKTEEPGAEPPVAETIPLPEPRTPSPEAEGPQQLDDVVVTAQHRKESAQKAAVALDVIDGDDIAESGITDISDLNNKIPALISNGTSTFIRGVGTFSILSYTDPAVAFNYDGTYLGRPPSTRGLMFDLERLEVLKGPQGTLYGRNATGGAVNVIPVAPGIGDDRLTGRASAGYASFDAYNVEGALNKGLGSFGGMRLSGIAVKQREGFQTDDAGDEGILSLRGQVKYEFSPNLAGRLAVDYAGIKNTGASAKYDSSQIYDANAGQWVVTPSNFATDEGVTSARSQAFREATFSQVVGRNFEAVPQKPFADNRMLGVTGHLDWVTDAGTLTAIPAWRHFDRDELVFLSHPIGGTETVEQYSFEPRFASEAIGPFEFTLGAYHYGERIGSDLRLNQQFSYANQFFTSDTQSAAAFGRVTASVTDALRLVGGARYSRDEKSIDGSTDGLALICLTIVTGTALCPNAQLLQYVDKVEDQPFIVPARGGPPIPQGAQGTILLRQFTNVVESLEQGKLTWRGAVEYDLAADSLVYGSVETGYRSGGLAIANGFETYEPENIIAYTLGSKNRFFGGAMQVNVELFDWEYENQQLGHTGTDADGNIGFLVENVGRSTIRGAEFDARALLPTSTMVGGTLQWLDTQYTSFQYEYPIIDVIPGLPTENSPPPRLGCPFAINDTATGYDVDCSGKPGFMSPEWTLNLNVAQVVPFDIGALTFGLETQYRSEYVIGVEYVPEQFQPARWRSGANITWEPYGSRVWSIGAFVRNIEDERNIQNSLQPGNINSLTYGEPRTFGVRVFSEF